jgi:hypothetical protein
VYVDKSNWTPLKKDQPTLCRQCGRRVTQRTAEIIVAKGSTPGSLVYRAVCQRCQRATTTGKSKGMGQ